MNIKKISQIILNNREIFIVLMVILVLMMMIVPLSSTIMDGIIGFNIGITVLVLMVVIYMKSPLSFTVFPSILLILALLRIGITVSTSRLILLEGDAGDIINTFGQFVVGGNLIVGIIIFIIITIINFIVITKGSERVAEVSARFSLDAMPGKQMSIDSDLRAGNITMEEASKKRKELGLESKLYGSMDGAMKFVKGDAIASMIDILINLVGGLIIGIVSNGMSFADAISHYSILTVGDGLVQQIPALIISLTSGMMLTAVSDSDQKEQNIGKNVLSQVFNDYRAIFAACFLLVIFAFIPGMPIYIFMILMALFCFIGYRVWKNNRKNNLDSSTNSAVVEEDGVGADDANYQNSASNPLIPLILCISTEYRKSERVKELKEIIVNVGQHMFSELGVVVPPIIIRYTDSLNSDEYQLQIFELPVITGVFYWNKILLLDNRSTTLDVLDVENSFENTLKCGLRNLGMWIKAENIEICKQFNIKYLTYRQFLVIHFKEYIKKFISEFLGLQEVKVMLEKMTDYQDLIKELFRMLPLNKVTEIFQRLVAEDISIRNTKKVLDTMLEWAQRDRDPVIITENVRVALGRFTAHKFSEGSCLFSSILISHDVEDIIRDGIRQTESGSYLSIDPRIKAEIIEKIRSIIDDIGELANVVVIVHMDIRRYLSSILEQDLSWLPVLSFQELEGNAQFNSIGVIEID